MKKFVIKSTQYPSPYEDDIVQCWRDNINKINQRWIDRFSDFVFIKHVLQGIIQKHGKPKKNEF